MISLPQKKITDRDRWSFHIFISASYLTIKKQRDYFEILLLDRAQAACVHQRISGGDIFDKRPSHRVSPIKIMKRYSTICVSGFTTRNAQLSLLQPYTGAIVTVPNLRNMDVWLSSYIVPPYIGFCEPYSGQLSALSAIACDVARSYSIRSFVVQAERGHVSWRIFGFGYGLRECSFIVETIIISRQSINEASKLRRKNRADQCSNKRIFNLHVSLSQMFGISCDEIFGFINDSLRRRSWRCGSAYALSIPLERTLPINGQHETGFGLPYSRSEWTINGKFTEAQKIRLVLKYVN